MTPARRPYLPFKIQAERVKKQHGCAWVTDTTAPTLEAAIDDATRLHEAFGRRVRVVDQEHVIFFRLPPIPKPAGRPRKPRV